VILAGNKHKRRAHREIAESAEKYRQKYRQKKKPGISPVFLCELRVRLGVLRVKL
jgi:hypothetical protein